VVTGLDRLARSLPDARVIADELTARQISVSAGAADRTCPIPTTTTSETNRQTLPAHTHPETHAHLDHIRSRAKGPEPWIRA
jgi:hypothetical protein